MKLLIVTQTVSKNDQLLGFFINWIVHFSQKFEKITILCLEKGEFDLPPNVKVISLGKDRGAGKLKQLFTFYFLLFTLHKNYDAVFVHMNPIWMVLGGMCWKILGKKRFLWYTSGGVTFKLKLAEKFADVIFTASKESFRIKSDKVIVTGHGIDTDLFKPNLTRSNLKDGALRFDLEEIKILSVGRIASVKNYETLIEAAKILKEGGVNFEITVVGEASPLERDKSYEFSIKDKIKKFGLNDRFNFAGKINHKELPGYYQAHDIFIHLSKTGSLDKALLEAMACGIKVLSSNDASKSFLSPGLIFDGNNPQELAVKILELKDDSFNYGLINYVVRNHGLENLVEKISQYIQR